MKGLETVKITPESMKLAKSDAIFYALLRKGENTRNEELKREVLGVLERCMHPREKVKGTIYSMRLHQEKKVENSKKIVFRISFGKVDKRLVIRI